MKSTDCHRKPDRKRSIDLPATAFQALDAYRVDDLIIEKPRLRLVLLLESPYQVEIRHGHPLAGTSGISAAKFLIRHVPRFYHWDPFAPLGCQIISRKEVRLGLMNCANYPLDRSVYRPEDAAAAPDLLEGLDLIRRTPGTRKRKKSFHRELEHDLIGNLNRRLAILPELTLVIPCGGTARRFMEKCGMDGIRSCPETVPHPSRNQWFWEKRFRDRDDFIATLIKHL